MFMQAPIIQNGIRFFVIPAKQFKTVSVRVNLYRPLCREEAAQNALITRLLKSATAQYPTPLALNRALDELFGASLSADIVKQGETAALSFGLSYLKDRYTGEEGTEQAAIRLLCQVIAQPLVQEGGFSPELFRIERENLKQKIQNRVNDKKTYARERCYEEMCRQEPFGIYEYGKIEDLVSLTPQGLYRHYQEILSSSMDVFLCGEVEPEQVIPFFTEHFAPRGALPQTRLTAPLPAPQTVTEEMEVNQGKLCLGFTTGVGADDPAFPALYLYNSIFGADVHSKLFQNVREKRSLAYYAYSGLERFKGILLVSSGIECNKFQEAYDEIMLQADAMRKGEFTNEEQKLSLRSIANRLRAMKDSPGALLSYAMTQALLPNPREPEQLMKALSAVTKEEIQAVAQQVQLHTVYFLKNQGGKQ